jgi:outer membrane protein assembly factor BamB
VRRVEAARGEEATMSVPEVPLGLRSGGRWRAVSAARAARAARSWRWLAVIALAPLAILPGSAAAQPKPPAGAPAADAAAAGAGAAGWANPNLDIANTRATTRTPINSGNVAKLKVKWRFQLGGPPTFFGYVASNPITVNGTVYLIDLNSVVYALDEQTGQLKWKHSFDSPNVGPNGIAYGWGVLYGTTFTGVFALDPRTGETLWSRELVTGGQGAIDIAPQLYDHTVLVSTVPSTFDRYVPGVMGMVWALDARTGAPKWQFNTVKDGYLWGHPEINSGGGLWYPPAVDRHGRVFISVGNPAPFPGTAEYPNGTSRPGPNLYTNSLVALDGRTGRLLWYQQPLPHDIRDYDLEDSPIVTDAAICGVRTEIVVVGGKMGAVYAYRADDGHPLWTLSVGRHQNDTGPLPAEPTAVYPGIFGGVESPMAVADGRLFVPWVDDVSMHTASGPLAFPDIATGTGGILAADLGTGRVLWSRGLPQMNFGAATVANDVVFTSSFDGTVYALSVRTGRTLWTAKTRAGINAFPAIHGDTLLVPAAAPAFFDQPVPELVAYSLR